jgi:hypothetical protein
MIAEHSLHELLDRPTMGGDDKANEHSKTAHNGGFSSRCDGLELA